MTEEKREMQYIVRILLTAIGSWGIIRVLTSCALPQVSDAMVVFFICIDSILCVVGIYTKEFVRKYLITAGIFFGAFAIIFMGFLKNGLRYLYNDCMYALETPYGLDLGRLAIQETDKKAMEENVAMMFLMFLVVLAVTLVVVYVHNMLGALLSILPVMIVFVSMAAIPDGLAFFLCISYVFGVSALYGYVGGERQSLAVLTICTIVSAVSVIVISPHAFHRLPVFEQLNQAAGEQWEWVGGNYQSFNVVPVAKGGINKGQLGKVDGIRYTNETIFTLKTSDIGKNQYFKEFIGHNYADNQWSEPMSTNLKEDLSSNLVDILDADDTLKSYIDGGQENYYDVVWKFPYAMEFTDGRRVNGIYISADVTGYTGFKNATDRMNIKKSRQYYNGIMNMSDYYAAEKKCRESVYQNYLQVPDNVKDIVNGLMGNVTVTTAEQKEYYIKYVKDYLAANYTYTLEPGKVPEGKDFVEYFLMEGRQGYCTYFATAAVMMYRCAGIPARYVEGYVVTEDLIVQGRAYAEKVQRYANGGSVLYLDKKNYTLEVHDNAAHAWVEVYMDGYGWVPIEVTPSNGRIDTAGSVENVQQAVQMTQGQEESTEESLEASSKEELPTEEIQETGSSEMEGASYNGADSIADTGETDKTGIELRTWFQSNPCFMAGVIFLAVCMAVVLMIFIRYFIVRQVRVVKGRKQNLKTMREEQLRQMVMEDYHKLEKMIAFAGFERIKGLEYEAYAGYLAEASDIFKKHHIKSIMELVLQISFSEMPVSVDAYRKMKHDIHAMREEIYRQQGLVRRFYFKFIKMF